MKVPLSWLKEFVDITLSPEDLAHIITMAGLEVGEVRFIGGEGAELPWDPEKVVVGNILEVRPHPNADRLVLADVEYGAAEPHTVVTGAPNLFAYKGQGRLPHPLKSVFAREGSRLYDGHKEGWEVVTLKGRPVRGIMSDAMLCSEKELGISDDHEGILFLEDDAPVGAPLRDVLGEVVFDIDLTPNLARCLSIVGVAREVAALTGATLRLPDPQVLMEGPPIEGRAYVTIEDTTLCPRFTVGLIENITVGPSPAWMQRRLRYAGMRPVNNIVDISNYVMLEWGEPTHAFDADRVHERHLVARLSRPGERLVTLDDKERDLTPFDGPVRGPMLVCDPQGPLGIAGVMGGADSEVSDTTTTVLLEAALWEPGQIRRTAQHYKLPSEASRRFERGVDIHVLTIAMRRALELMRIVARGTVATGIIDVYPEPYRPRVLDLPPGEVWRMLGVTLSAHDIAEMLNDLGFACQVRGVSGIGDLSELAGTVMDPLTVQVSIPSFRQDVSGLADLIEEIARVYGYDNIPTTQMADELPPTDYHPDIDLERRVRSVLLGSGLDEAINYSMTSLEAVAKINPAEAQAEHYLRISNPIAPEREYLQRSLLPTLLESMALSLRERDRVLFFEIGRAYLPRTTPDTDGSWLPDEPRRVALALAGPRLPLDWNNASSESMDFFDIKGIADLLLERLGLGTCAHYEPLTDDERLHPGRAARLLVARPETDQKGRPVAGAPVSIGVLGELHPNACERLEIAVPRVLVAELDLDPLVALMQPPTYTSISRYPATVQDLAWVVPEEVPAAQVESLIRSSAGTMLETVTLFDIYSGPQVGEGMRSLAYRLAFRAPDRTLSDEAIARVRTKIVKTLEREVGAVLRA